MKPHPYAEMLPIMDSADLEKLGADIKKNGLREPITTLDGMILDGRNRSAACDLVYIKPTTVEFKGTSAQALAFVVGKNLMRRHMSPSQRAMAGEKLLAAEQELAKQRQVAAQNNKAGAAAREKLGAQSPATSLGKNAQTAQVKKDSKSEPERARDRVADVVKVAPKMIDAAAKVRANAVPEVIKAVEDDDVAVTDAALVAKMPAELQKKALAAVKAGSARTLSKAVTAIEKKAQEAELRAQPLPMPDGPFGVIVADPPWKYGFRDEDESHRGRTDYSTMTIEEIAALGAEVQKRAAKDCLLWLWVTNAFLVDGGAPIQQVLKAWGFEGKTLLTWDKERLGVGNFLRNSTEHVVLAVRGKPAIRGESTGTSMHAPRREHSRKPDEFFSLIETICPDARRLEMFSRTPRAGWQVWGAQTEKFADGGSAA